jgi:hypothetical protein
MMGLQQKHFMKSVIIRKMCLLLYKMNMETDLEASLVLLLNHQLESISLMVLILFSLLIINKFINKVIINILFVAMIILDQFLEKDMIFVFLTIAIKFKITLIIFLNPMDSIKEQIEMICIKIFILK